MVGRGVFGETTDVRVGTTELILERTVEEDEGFGVVWLELTITDEVLLGRIVEVEGSFGVATEEELLGFELVSTEDVLLLGSSVKDEVDEILGIVVTMEGEVGACKELLLD